MELRKLSLEELSGVLSMYPWFGAARAELCRRMKDEAAAGDLAALALWVGDRRKIESMLRSSQRKDYSDKNAREILKSMLEPAPKRRRVVASGADYFTQEEYDKASKEQDNVFSRLGAQVRSESTERVHPGDFFCTETLARIYLEQGYPEEAERIYSKLILANPEKSAYFASLIEKLKN